MSILRPSSCSPCHIRYGQDQHPKPLQVCCSSSQQETTPVRKAQPRSSHVSRRAALAAGSLVLPLLPASTQLAHAGIVQDLAASFIRPELPSKDAVVMLMDARGTLLEIKNLAATPMDSQDRFEARRLLPGMAARLRMVGQAAPIVAALSKSGKAAAGKEAAVSELYGGSGGERAVTDEVYSAIGSIVTISGRTIRKEALAGPELAESAIRHVEDLLALVPQDALKSAEEFRARRRSVAA